MVTLGASPQKAEHSPQKIPHFPLALAPIVLQHFTKIADLVDSKAARVRYEQLVVDMLAYSVDIGVVTETHLKAKHADEAFRIDGYSLIRRDRKARKGGAE